MSQSLEKNQLRQTDVRSQVKVLINASGCVAAAAATVLLNEISLS